MKRIWNLLLIFSFLAIGFSSCSDDAEEEWRDKNIAFYEKIAAQSDVHEIIEKNNGRTGIYYQILKEGNGGAKPIIGNVLNLDYAGWTYNDTIHYTTNRVLNINDTFDYNNDYSFRLGSDAIAAWNIAIQYMTVGEKWRVFIPYYQGYGSTAQTDIPAYSTLIFDIYLKEIVSVN
ncbi:MAG: FKBP-type peptidyl-prolyl cis-trans isomerase [Bacteroidales bacterium]|nr:FKBP-type peptidyl-prolyl cis-trans isomerase [Bacteroidales bacterium]